MQELLISFENTVTFLFLIITVTFSGSDARHQKKQKLCRILLFTLIFTVLNETFFRLMTYMNVYFFALSSVLLFLIGIGYLFVCFRNNFLCHLALFISQALFLLALRGSLSGFSDMIEHGTGSFFLSRGFFYLFFYGFGALSCALFLRYPLRYVAELPSRTIFLMLCTPCLLFILAEYFVNIAHTNGTVLTISLSFFSLLIMTSLVTYYLFYTITETFHEKSQSQLISQRLELQLNNVERSIGMVEQIRRDKHEMKNVYFYIQSLIKSGELDELEKFVDTKLVPRYDRLEEFNPGNQMLDYLLTQKINEARDLAIHTYADVRIPSDLPVEDSDLSGLLLNLLDNAIDASRDVKNADIQINIGILKSYLSIQIKNRTNENVLANNPELHTSKTDKTCHGYGLKIVRSIVDKYNGIINIQMEGGYFCTRVMLECI